jgi:hypothetical protein
MTLVWRQCPSLEVMSSLAKQRVGCMTSAEKLPVCNSGILLLIGVTQIISFGCISQRMKRGLLEGAPSGTVAPCHASGWIHTDIWLGGWNALWSVWCSRENIPFSCCWIDIFTHTQKSIVAMGNASENGAVKLYFPCTLRTRCNSMTWGSYNPVAKPTIEIQRHGSGTIQRGNRNLSQPPSWRTTPCRLSATAYSIYSQLSSVLESVPPSTTWGRALLCWEEPTYNG